MVDKSKSGKSDKPKTAGEEVKSEINPDVTGLTASLAALNSITDDGDKNANGDVVHLSSRSKKKQKSGNGSTVEGSAKQRSTKQKSAVSHDETPLKDNLEPLGVVELLGALKSDIDSLRQDNEEFKARLMSSPLARGNTFSQASDDSIELRSLLKALQADIGNLREENDVLRTEAFSAQDNSPAAESEDEELFGMLVGLKDDIDSLRSENDALRVGEGQRSPAKSAQKSDDVTKVLRELKSDINDLKHDNEALRLENLTARDGAPFENIGDQHGAYRYSESGVASGLLKTVGALALVAIAAGGGYYFAKTQGGSQVSMDRSMPVPASGGNIALNQPIAKLAPRTKPATLVGKPATAPLAAPVRTQLVKVSPAPAPATLPKPTVSSDVETAMMSRASGLMEARDIGAARMVFVYLARHGSAVAMTRLAQTYDPQFLGLQGFDEGKNSDLIRAKRLYGAASGMGDRAATTRLLEMQ